jgi:acetylornithine deacetylase/succinyl-diaminopimelate desuccinylase-like protein
MAASGISHLAQRLKPLIDRERLVRTVTELVAIPSPTGDAGAVLDRLTAMLRDEGFAVERPDGGYPRSPAVAVRLESGRQGPTLQFNGHLDTVHLPFVPPGIDGDHITGSGSCDMKGGTAAAVEAIRVLRDSGALESGSVLFTAHDLHEAPWGDGRQLEALIRSGVCGDAVLIPEYLNACLPIVGRGLATWKVTLSRPGAPIHEVMRPADEPAVIDAAAELVARIRQYSGHLAAKADPLAGCETVFVGQIHSGEIFNQYPKESWLEGTRRWLPGETPSSVEAEFKNLVEQVARRNRVSARVDYQCVRDGFKLDPAEKVVEAFQHSHATISPDSGPLPLGAKPFCDDCNTFWAVGNIPGVTHGPRGFGAHTLNEWVSIDDLVRVAHVYALTAATYCRDT